MMSHFHAHGFSPHAFDEERRKWQDPEAVLKGIGLKAGSVFLDLGCGGGFFALPAARLVGPEGRVYGIDVNGEAVRELGKLAAKEGLKNIELTVGKAEEVLLCDGCGDIAFCGIVLHDFADPGKVLVNARKMLKPSGMLANLDWKKEPGTMGPPFPKRFSPEYASGLIAGAGFRVSSIRDAGPHHYLIIAELP
ncbi:MAG: class I SAM-dependent methyltransferase [Chloroflexota bacterium]